jgi:Zn-dependent protease with chaperone function
MKKIILLSLLISLTVVQLIESYNLWLYGIIIVYVLLTYLVGKRGLERLNNLSKSKNVFGNDIRIFPNTMASLALASKDTIFVSSKMFDDAHENIIGVIEHERVHQEKNHLVYISSATYICIASNILTIYGLITEDFYVAILGIIALMVYSMLRKSLELEADSLASKQIGADRYIKTLEYLSKNCSNSNNPKGWKKMLLLISTHPSITNRMHRIEKLTK